MSVNTWAAFAGSDEDELQPALKSLRAEGINIVAIHMHITHEEPRILFFHYWAADLPNNSPNRSKRR